ncbi:hypothetical protein ADUPG1_010301 [Aduncisulcus paluster]|uniref:Uncharacterized protein n=1 Tax=Aduncisulcus paluster TaxID=2918883 RepID=A0ABQ5JTV3_9EUKA|nr:hypothetical protein ADUPG1_010301 [Aduncisulcus paluster]
MVLLNPDSESVSNPSTSRSGSKSFVKSGYLFHIISSSLEICIGILLECAMVGLCQLDLVLIAISQGLKIDKNDTIQACIRKIYDTLSEEKSVGRKKREKTFIEENLLKMRGKGTIKIILNYLYTFICEIQSACGLLSGSVMLWKLRQDIVCAQCGYSGSLQSVPSKSSTFTPTLSTIRESPFIPSLYFNLSELEKDVSMTLLHSHMLNWLAKGALGGMDRVWSYAKCVFQAQLDRSSLSSSDSGSSDSGSFVSDARDSGVVKSADTLITFLERMLHGYITKQRGKISDLSIEKTDLESVSDHFIPSSNVSSLLVLQSIVGAVFSLPFSASACILRSCQLLKRRLIYERMNIDSSSGKLKSTTSVSESVSTSLSALLSGRSIEKGYDAEDCFARVCYVGFIHEAGCGNVDQAKTYLLNIVTHSLRYVDRSFVSLVDYFGHGISVERQSFLLGCGDHLSLTKCVHEWEDALYIQRLEMNDAVVKYPRTYARLSILSHVMPKLLDSGLSPLAQNLPIPLNRKERVIVANNMFKRAIQESKRKI